MKRKFRPPRKPLATFAVAIGLGVASLAASQSLEGMGKPNLDAHWGSSTEKARRPAAPHRTDVPWLQTLVDAAPEGSVLKPPPGVYSGPVLINKRLTLDGAGQVTVDGGGKGTVLVWETNDGALRNIHLTGSGDSHDSDDTCLNLRGSRNVIEGVRIDDCLFGIDLKQSNDNTLRENSIRSKVKELGVRGDGLRLWYSNGNLIEKNEVIDSRDMVAWYSHHNIFRGNIGKRSRYSIHFMFAKDNLVEGNSFTDNAVGVYLMYTERIHVRNNIISHATGAAGMALGFKESSDSDVENNEIIYCAVGVGSDLSPFEPDTTLRFKGNRFAFNGIAVRFTSELGGNILTDNVFEGNLTDVVQMGRDVAGKNVWKSNYFADYQGFDRNGDGVGDTPYELYAYADQIWIETPAAQFFKTAPVLELLDFLERLAPFSSPELQLRDPSPRFAKPGSLPHS
ncbi:MAG TPA: nitrous oxide reductase family maturation protein NosD [Rhodocyclaceae bacterium]|nr:nitrous oxide reductase family maturation protein NosD [Rhodocyclaceae bacterium]HMV21753.1 nitrous oxide reductase family maturation protein NosD [Rhodocyclaceae bacterium]HMW77516.1 nitrous oxide reductase family maturation protein NosD [Rhodocyclaceae bacterium]HNE43438.1 nitrous oxide reductase family maturation protein NosD [Rhodocyclaceae bacterium]HNL20774.1 nitrous oxide reductase family maturation protein NosD [Rhodocyclaceae bacterium]